MAINAEHTYRKCVPRKRKARASNQTACGAKKEIASDDLENSVNTKEEISEKRKDETLAFVPEDVTEKGRRALGALKNYVADKSNKSLFPDIDHAVGLTILYKKPALVSKKARLRIVLPASHRTPSNTSVCIIMPDLDQSAEARKDPDVDKQARQWAEKIEKDHGLTNQHYAKVVLIITKRQLEREYHTYTQRRALATMYDLFLVDARVGRTVRSFLGKDFYKVHKEPLDFKYTKPLVTAIEQAVKTTIMKLHRYATRINNCFHCRHVSFGHLGQDLEALGRNFDEVISAVINNCPGGFNNIRSIYLQLVGSTPSLPVYFDNVVLERPKKRRRGVEEVCDECSTLPDGLKLAVRRDGKIRVLKENTGASVYYPTVHDEWEERDSLKPTIDPEKLKRKRAIKKKQSIKRKIQKKIKLGELVVVRPERAKSSKLFNEYPMVLLGETNAVAFVELPYVCRIKLENLHSCKSQGFGRQIVNNSGHSEFQQPKALIAPMGLKIFLE
ncbi:hypothetical protein DICVIV_08100 [Dictyocaulus viviparus]|uniref:Ribosomal protein L1p/L10e family protein n=1 Tax=Dictyocaulus viviparus TaxID=29172 RepID=A0A0D8XMT6_DICVI|nr:hypothetical protein DICVIV_08100 [Dictyocaulus viviparus]